VRYKLVRGAVPTGGGSERDDLPSAVLFVEAEEISAAMIELAIDEEVEGSPDDRQIVVDPDLRIVDPFLDVRGSRGRHAVGEVLYRDLPQVALHRHHKNTTRQPGSLDGRRIPMRHAVEHGLHRSQDSRFTLSPRAPAEYPTAKQTAMK
jgi:hypothetical protein